MRFSVFAVKLFSSDSTGGASTLASAAIDASVCIHNCNTILNGDSTNGASAPRKRRSQHMRQKPCVP